MKQTLDNGAFQ